MFSIPLATRTPRSGRRTELIPLATRTPRIGRRAVFSILWQLGHHVQARRFRHLWQHLSNLDRAHLMRTCRPIARHCRRRWALRWRMPVHRRMVGLRPRRARRRMCRRRRPRFPGQTFKVHIPLVVHLVTPLCRHGYRDVGYHITAQLTCLLYFYRKRRREVDDGKDKKDASYYLVLAHFSQK